MEKPLEEIFALGRTFRRVFTSREGSEVGRYFIINPLGTLNMRWDCDGRIVSGKYDEVVLEYGGDPQKLVSSTPSGRAISDDDWTEKIKIKIGEIMIPHKEFNGFILENYRRYRMNNIGTGLPVIEREELKLSLCRYVPFMMGDPTLILPQGGFVSSYGNYPLGVAKRGRSLSPLQTVTLSRRKV